MIHKLISLKNKNKVLFYLLLPLLSVVLIFKVLMSFNVLFGKKDIKKTEKNDFDLKSEQEEANRKANELLKEAAGHKAKAEAYEEKADNADTSLDWHTKSKK